LQHVFRPPGRAGVFHGCHFRNTRSTCDVRSLQDLDLPSFPRHASWLFYPFTPGAAPPGASTADVEVDWVYSGSRPARRYRVHRSAFAPVAAQLAAPVALGLLVGGVLAYQAGSTNNAVQPVPLGAVATPTPSFGRPSASTPTPAATTATTTTNGDCGIVVPANPLSARQLATLYQLTGGMTLAQSGCT
jgi:hypothetical protein